MNVLNPVIHSAVATGVVASTFILKSKLYDKIAIVVSSALYLLSAYTQRFNKLAGLGITIISAISLRSNPKLALLFSLVIGVTQVVIHRIVPKKLFVDSEILKLDSILNQITKYNDLMMAQNNSAADQLIEKESSLFLRKEGFLYVLKSPEIGGQELAIGLSVTETNPSYPFDRYLSLMGMLSRKIAEQYPNKSQRLNYVSLGAGNMLFDWYCIAFMISEGYKDISISLIDTAYDKNEKTEEAAELEPEAKAKNAQFSSTLKRYANAKGACIQSALYPNCKDFNSKLKKGEKVHVFTGVNFSWANINFHTELSEQLQNIKGHFDAKCTSLLASDNSRTPYFGYSAKCFPDEKETTSSFLQKLLNL